MASRGSKRLVGWFLLSSPRSHLTASTKSRCHSSSPVTTTSTNLSSLLPPVFDTAAAPSSNGLLRRFLHQTRGRAGGRTSSFTLPLKERLGLPDGEGLLEKLRGVGSQRAPIIDALARPPIPPDIHDDRRDNDGKERAVKVLASMSKRLRTEAVKERLKSLPDASISHADFLRICRDESKGDESDGAAVARALDDCGIVLVIGNLVFVRPEQVVQALEAAMAPHYPKKTRSSVSNPTTTTEDPQPQQPAASSSSSELRELDAQLAEINTKAAASARRELWAGLFLLMAQTVGFARLTFWELSWDVMEPVCFYVTSLYFMAGYAYFLRTDKDPSFEGVFQTRFHSRRRRLIRDTGFNIQRYEELRRQKQPIGDDLSPAFGAAAAAAASMPHSMTMGTYVAQMRPSMTWSPSSLHDDSSPGCCQCRRRLV